MQLLVHPATTRGPVQTFDVDAHRQGGRMLHLSYRLDADLSQLRLPAHLTPRRADDLWRHTCFEAFIAESGSAGYSELNFSPSGQWAAYTFTGRRSGMRAPNLEVAPSATWRRTEGQLELNVEIRLDGLLSGPVDSALRLALSAVIEEESGTISYWALRHPDTQPDFHHPDGFVIELPGHEPAKK
jgi:hypothetical protein